MAGLASDTQLVGGEGRYTATLSRSWEIWGPNGGYLATLALRAAGAEAVIPRPASFSCQFLRTAQFAPVTVEVEALRRGRRSEAFAVNVVQDGSPVLAALVRTAAAGPGLAHDVAPAPEAPAPADAAPDPDGPSHHHAFWSHFDTRWIDPSATELASRDGGAAYPPRRLSWHRLLPDARFDDPFLDAARPLLLIDTLTWPAAALPHPDPEFLAPSLDLAVWVHRPVAESDWLLVDARAPVAEEALMGTHGRVYDEAGRLVASGGAQLYCVPRPPEG